MRSNPCLSLRSKRMTTRSTYEGLQEHLSDFYKDFYNQKTAVAELLTQVAAHLEHEYGFPTGAIAFAPLSEELKPERSSLAYVALRQQPSTAWSLNLLVKIEASGGHIWLALRPEFRYAECIYEVVLEGAQVFIGTAVDGAVRALSEAIVGKTTQSLSRLNSPDDPSRRIIGFSPGR